MSKPFGTRNGKESQSDTDVEVPASATTPLSNFAPPFTDTEVEEVNGRPAVRPAQGDKEVSNRSTETEGAETDTVMEDPGSESTLVETVALDAFFASYSELLPLESSLHTEVIIGTDERTRISPTTAFPWRAICALKITAQNGTRWIGTGWMVSPRTVITAGHCVYMHDQGGWAKSIEVIPAQDGLNVKPFGTAMATTFRSVTGWTQSKNRENDYGAIILPTNKRLGDQTGYFGYAVREDAYLAAAVMNLSGYPGDKPASSTPKGTEQWFMALKPKSISSRVITYNIDTMGGQSGAPVWIKVGDARYVIGIHTNGHSTGNSATRITQGVFNNIQAWKAQGM
jgi:V8-like Glu-specific endopeptidase